MSPGVRNNVTISDRHSPRGAGCALFHPLNRTTNNPQINTMAGVVSLTLVLYRPLLPLLTPI